MKTPAIDIETLAPKLERLTLVDRAKRAAGEEPHEFEVELFVSARAGVVLINEFETIQAALSGKIDDKTIDLLYQLFSSVFIRQHPFMTPEWIEANVDLAQCVVILTELAMPIYKYLQEVGLLGTAETPQAKKNPRR